MAQLQSIRIAGWKSIEDMEPRLELGPINVLIGANGSGKSNFVSFFKMVAELMSGRLQDYVGRLGGADSLLYHGSRVTAQISADMDFETEFGPIGYTFHLSPAAPDALWIKEERLAIESALANPFWMIKGPKPESGICALAGQGEAFAGTTRDFLNRCRVFHFRDTSETAKIRLTGYIEANQGLYSDGGNLAAMLYLYRQTKPNVYRRIVSTVRHIMPTFDDFVLGPQRLNPRNIILNWKQRGSDYLFGPHQLSDGTLRAMALTTLFLQPSEDLPAILIVDEPELGLHPHAIEIIAGLIRAASLKTQVILTTQSTTFLDHFEPEEIIVVDDEQGHSVFRRLDAVQLKDWLEDYSVGQLWEKNVLGGGPLS